MYCIEIENKSCSGEKGKEHEGIKNLVRLICHILLIIFIRNEDPDPEVKICMYNLLSFKDFFPMMLFWV